MAITFKHLTIFRFGQLTLIKVQLKRQNRGRGRGIESWKYSAV